MDELKVELLSEKNDSQDTQSPGFKQCKRLELRVKNPKMQKHFHPWKYPALGESKEISIPSDEIQMSRGAIEAPKHHQLSEWLSTAICGNDVLASVLYSSGMVAGKAGKLAPVIQLLIAIVLYCFRYIYEQAVTAIPLNGGSYNILLNTTSKRTAVIAATFGIITYLATGVASGTTAISYLNTQVSIDDDDGGVIPVVFGTICLFFVVAILPCIGIKESGKIALIIFIFHVLTLSILAFYSMIYAFQHPEILTQNILHTKFPDIDVIATGTDDTTDTGGSIILHGTFFTALFFGYSTAMLGTRTTSSFETCAQFIEQQKTGVFQKTLRNLWLFS
jgi:amino acid transporter